MTKELLRGKCERRYLDTELDGIPLRIRSITDAELSDFESQFVRSNGKMNEVALAERRKRMIALCLVDDDGKRLYANANELGDLDGGFALQLFSLCESHCGTDRRKAVDLKKDEQDSGETTD